MCVYIYIYICIHTYIIIISSSIITYMIVTTVITDSAIIVIIIGMISSITPGRSGGRPGGAGAQVAGRGDICIIHVCIYIYIYTHTHTHTYTHV